MKKSLLLVLPLCTTLVFGAKVTHTDYTAGAVISAAGQNSNENTIFNEFNGNIDNTNIKTGGIANANIPANTLTGDRLLTTDTTLHTSSGTIDQFNSSTYTTAGFQTYGLIQSTTVVVTASSCTASTVYVPTLTTINFTPKRATSHIEVTLNAVIRSLTGSANFPHGTLYRNSTNLAGSSDFCVLAVGSAVEIAGICSIDIIDTPNTTSSVTYALYTRTENASTPTCTNTLNGSTPTSFITVKEWAY